MSPQLILNKFYQELAPLYKIYCDQGYDLRLVGGCVRDAFLGEVANDVDLATHLPPEQGLELLKRNGIECLPTGIKYGTITAILNKKPYEITTLRQDVTTDGRRPEVTYSTDWIEDAKRRDLTINAIYADFEGNIYDYFNGVKDLENGVICFIGDATARINEDYLRLLRLFRFYAWYGKALIDDTTLEVCKQLSSKLKLLSSERITKEFLRLLEAPNPSYSLILMNKSNLLSTLFQTYSLENILTLISIEKNLSLTPNPLLRLATLTKDYTHFRLSNAQLNQIKKIYALSKEDLFTETIYRYYLSIEKLERIMDAFIIKCIPLDISQAELKKTLTIFCKLQVPDFPLNGDDLILLGISGPEVGKWLRKCRLWWAKEKFIPSKEKCLSWILQQKA